MVPVSTSDLCKRRGRRRAGAMRPRAKYVPLVGPAALSPGACSPGGDRTCWWRQLLSTIHARTRSVMAGSFGLAILPASIFYDGPGFMVPKKLNVKGLAELGGAHVSCVAQGHEQHEFKHGELVSARPRHDHQAVVYEKPGPHVRGVLLLFSAAACRMPWTQDFLGALPRRWRRRGQAGPTTWSCPNNHLQGAAWARCFVRPRRTMSWMTVVRWSLFAMLEAEERGHHQPRPMSTSS